MRRFGPDAAAGTGGFTLPELLIVILIIGVLAALLIPSLSDVFAAAQMTRCQSNLHTLWEAFGVWRAEHDGGLLNGGSWPGRLLPYVEYNLDVFKCPARAELTYGRPGFDYGAVEASSEEGQRLLSEYTDLAEGSDEPDPVDASFEFYVYHQAGWDPARPDYVPNSGIRSDLAYTIPLDNHPWVQRFPEKGRVFYKVDDEGSTGGRNNVPTYDDMWFYIYYDERGQPTKIEILQQPCRTSPYKKYFIDFLVNGEVFIKDWVKHIGETREFTFQQSDSGLSEERQYRWNAETQKYEAFDRPLIVLGDYALSRGSYERPDGTLVSHMDPKLFFILDFGFGKSVADFNHGGNTEDDWDKYFITDPEAWKRAYPDLAEKKGWQAFQALRHFGCANVLFCDGHIESLTAGDLHYNNPLWYYQGR